VARVGVKGQAVASAGLDVFGRRLEVPEGTPDDGDPIF